MKEKEEKSNFINEVQDRDVRIESDKTKRDAFQCVIYLIAMLFAGTNAQSPRPKT